MKTHKFIMMALLFCFVFPSFGSPDALELAENPKKKEVNVTFVLNSTLIDNGSPQFRIRGIERLEIYALSVFCDGDTNLENHQFLSKDFVEIQLNKTFYHLFNLICVKDVYEVCDSEIKLKTDDQGKTIFENREALMTNGSKILVNQAREYFICEHRQHKMYTFLNREQILKNLNTSEEKYPSLRKYKKWTVDMKLIKMVRDYLKNKRKEIEEYRRALAVETGQEPVVLYYEIIESGNDFEPEKIYSNWKQVLAVFSSFFAAVLTLAFYLAFTNLQKIRGALNA